MVATKKLVKDTLVLGLTSLGLGALGMVFNVYLSRTVGTDGVGLYALIGSVYVFATTFATSGISLSVTRLVTDTVASRGTTDGVGGVMMRALLFCAGLGALACGGLLVLAPLAGRAVSDDVRVADCFRILAFGLPFMSVSSCLSGFFIACRRAERTAAAAACENLCEMAFVVVLLTLVRPHTPEDGCVLLVLGRVASEGCGCALSYVFYRMEKRGLKKAGLPEGGVLRPLLRVGAPVAASSYLRSGLTTLENLLVPVGLCAYGMERTEALELFGSVKGLAVPAVFFPASLLYAFVRVLVPEIADAHTRSDKEMIDRASSRILRLTLIFATASAAVFAVFSRPLGALVLSDESKGVYFLLLAPLVPAMYLDGVVDGILKGMDEQFAVMRFNVYEAVLRVALVYFVLPRTGTVGFFITVYAGNVINTALSLRHLLRRTHIRVPLWQGLCLPALCVTAPALGAYLFLDRLCALTPLAVAVAGILLSLAPGGALLQALGTVDFRRAKEWLKKES